MASAVYGNRYHTVGLEIFSSAGFRAWVEGVDLWPCEKRGMT